jgi:predicted HTH domain antitoxin
MNVIEIEDPESIAAALNLSPDSFQKEAGIALGAKLYEMGRLSSGQAAQLAGISRKDFLFTCHKLGAATVEWDNEEIESEFSVERPL